MKTISIVSVLFIGLAISAFISSDEPQAEITNGLITAKIYLPDAENGFYRARRFDWSGVVFSLEFQGHNYFGQWFDNYFPTSNSAMMGPAEEFGPLNYEEANPGEDFVKIGVGVLTKTSDSIYDKHVLYPFVDPGKWKIIKEADNIQFIHVLNNENYSYEYTKVVHLVEGKPEMHVSHILKNTGKLSIDTHVLNHNFFMIDNQATGTGLEVTFPVNVSGTGKGIPDIFDFHENKIFFKRNLVKGESVFCESVEGFSNGISDYDIRIENLITGAGARIRADQPLVKLHFWANSTTICPEPYIDIKVEPGEEFSWSCFYEFYISDN